METLTRRVLGSLLAAIAVIAVAAPLVLAQAVALDARVIWVQGDRAYLVSSDSTAVAWGATLHLFDRKKWVAAATVTGVQDGTLIVARLTSGSLAKTKHLDRLRVTRERVGSEPRSLLRIGYPSQARTQPFFQCRRMVLDAHGYRGDTLGVRSYQLVRDRDPDHPLPDTLMVRLFDDAADEEIALERGELDAAVFWPGEASAHIREVMRWQGKPNVPRTRGVVVNYAGPGREASPLYEPDRARLDSLNQELFRGDLRPGGARLTTASPMTPSRFEVDPNCPAKGRIETFLNRGRPAGRGPLRFITYIDEPIDSVLVEASNGQVFLMSCPMISRPELRPYLESIDLPAIVNLFDCETAGRKR